MGQRPCERLVVGSDDPLQTRIGTSWSLSGQSCIAFSARISSLMDTTNSMRRLILSVVGGYLIITAVTLLTFIGLNASRANLGSLRWLVGKLLISLASGALGGYAASRLAGVDRVRAVWALAGLMTALSIAAVLVKFGSEPLWFQAALVLGAGPAVWACGQSRGVQSAGSARSQGSGSAS